MEGKIGIECYINQNQKDNWARALAFLVSETLTTKKISEACLKWKGYKLEKTENPEIFNMFFRKINHIKLVYTPGKPLEAKI